jgi:putative CRISPR-associated protein (TIGR02620 family)
MARYFIQAKKIFPLNSKEKLFIGPFDKKNKALMELNAIREKVKYEIILDPYHMPKTQEGVIMQIMSNTDAVRAGMKNSQKNIPLRIEEFVKKNGNVEKKVSEKKIDIPLIVSKYSSTEEWLEKNGIIGEVVSRANPGIVKNRIVIGQIPYRLASLAKEVKVIDLPRLSSDMLGRELTADDLDKAGANIQDFKVIKLTSEWRKVFEYLNDQDNFDYILEQVLEQTIK